MTPAKGMIGKELRQNLNWAALGLLAMSASLLWALWQHRTKFYTYEGYATSGMPILTEQFQSITIVGSALVGLLLGLMQILPEKSLDQWAFLVHRPVSRTRLFFYKISAGLLLYALATGVPIAAAIAWVATPNHVPAPFTPGMALPALADWLAGLGYYFAALVIGLREVRWYGSRILAGGVAVGASILVFMVPVFSWALILLAIALPTLLIAAWGSFLTGGHYDRQPWLAKVALGSAVFTGIAMLVGTGTVMLSEAIPYRNTTGYEYAYYSLIDDGRIVRFKTRDNEFVEATDISGKSIPDALKDARSQHENQEGDVRLSLDRNDRSAFEPAEYRQESTYLRTLYDGGFQTWYYMPGKQYGVGYETRTAGIIGYFGPEGFSDAAPPVARFEDRASMIFGYRYYHQSIDPSSLTFRAGKFRFNFGTKEIIKDFAPPAGEQLESFGTGQVDPDEAYMRGRTPEITFEAFATNKSVTVRDSDGRTRFTVPLEHTPANGYDGVTVARRGEPARYFLWYQPGYRKGESKMTRPGHVVEVNGTGEVVARQALPPIVHDDQHSIAPVQPRHVVLAAASPPIAIAMNFLSMWWQHGMEGVRHSYVGRTSRWAVTVCILSALLSAAASLLVARRQNASARRTIGWFATVFLIGPTALLTMLCLAAWPQCERCPSCNRRRPVDRETCPNCGAEFALPALDGTEIFAM
jgi:hypothetical protein